MREYLNSKLADLQSMSEQLKDTVFYFAIYVDTESDEWVWRQHGPLVEQLHTSTDGTALWPDSSLYDLDNDTVDVYALGAVDKEAAQNKVDELLRYFSATLWKPAAGLERGTVEVPMNKPRM